jgi:hypothetical protein
MARSSRYPPEGRERSLRLVLDQADKHSTQWTVPEVYAGWEESNFARLQFRSALRSEGIPGAGSERAQ